MDPPKLILYSSPMSDCSARVRLALGLKDIPYECMSVSLTNKGHQNEAFRAINPAQTLPTLLVIPPNPDEGRRLVLAQTAAILEYLEEAYPSTVSLLPSVQQAHARAVVRSMAGIVATDIHPLTTHRATQTIQARFLPGVSESDARQFIVDWDLVWMQNGLAKYEALAADHAGCYSFGDAITLADVHLMPQVWTASRMGADLTPYPTIRRVVENLSQQRVFVQERHLPSDKHIRWSWSYIHS